MCAKLKCCLNYEVDDYMEAARMLPPKDAVLQTQDADYYYFKADILAGLVSYSTDKKIPANVETITAERAKEIIELNKAGEKPLSLQEEGAAKDNDGPKDLLDDDISRFDKSKKKKKKKKPKTDAAKNTEPAPSQKAKTPPAKKDHGEMPTPPAAATPGAGPQQPNRRNNPRKQRPPRAQEEQQPRREQAGKRPDNPKNE